MYTSIVLVALAGSTLSAAAETPAFRSDYVAARQLGSKERKPLAIFVGNGAQGWDKRTTDGQLSQGAQELLKNYYVCVYVDTGTEDGARLSRDFGMPSGLVLSDASGAYQAFRTTGLLSNGDLERQLTKYADPARVVVRTDTEVSNEVRYYPTSEAAPSYSPYMAPSSYCPSCNRR